MNQPRPTLHTAIDQYIDGDDHAGNAICDGLETPVRGVVFRVLPSSDADAKDVIQDTLLAVLGYLRSAEAAPRNIEAFACTIARNRCVNLLVWRRRRHAADVDRFAESVPDIAASPLELVEERSVKELLEKILTRLDQACRELLQSIYRAEIPVEEVRGSLGLKSVQAVYYRKDVCIRKAQKILNQMLLSSQTAERGLIPDPEPERTDD